MFGDIFRVAAPIAAGYFGGPAMAGLTGGATSGAIAAGALTGAGIAALTGQDMLGGAVTGGLGGMTGGGLNTATTAAKLKAQTGLTDAAANKLITESAIKQGGQQMTAGLTGTTGEIGANLGQTIDTAGSLRAYPNIGTTGAGSGATINQAYRPDFMATTSANMPVREAAFGTDYGVRDVAREFGKGSEAMGYGKAGIAGLGVASQLGAFDPDMPEYGDDPMSKYDPKRRLNLGAIDTGLKLNRDTGLRLLAEGGEVQKYANGGMAQFGMAPPPPPPEYGIVDVGGSFVKTSDDPGPGLITKDEFYDRFKFKAPGGDTSAEQNQAGGGDGGMEAINKAASAGKPSTGAIAALAQGFAQQQMNPPTKSQTLGLEALAGGGYLETGGEVGDGMSDEIEATIEGTQEARLSDGEFVIPADVVSHLGNGSSDAGARRLYEMMDKVRMARTGNKKQGKEIEPERYMPR